MSTNDVFDKSREQYVDYGLYLAKRAGNRYYNLGYKYYIEIQSLTIPYTTGDLATHFTPAYRNFEIALLFNSHDVVATQRKKELCSLWQQNALVIAMPDAAALAVITASAKKIYKDCKC